MGKAIKHTLAAQKERAREVYRRLTALYPEIRCTLDYHSPFQLLLMTSLAAQCTDARVNIVCKTLFQKYPGPADFLKVPIKQLEEDVRPCGFYRNKAKNILETCRILMEDFGGEVPQTMEELTRLAGVGRKTANVILGECFGKQGVIVDTHCTRLTNRLGFSTTQDPVKIEQQLMKVWPPEHWTLFSHFMVFHGRAVCTARAPKCSACTLADLCPFPESREGAKIAR
ncbi:MAG: endonuclease III [Candidatus Hydrogenedentes bacterium]|nr:endonuclease III [Candidatus Hydrogenedentota bacterium]